MEKQLIPVGYKQTEVGVIPEDWDAQPLSELTTLMTNGFVGTAKTHYTDSNDGVLYIQGYNVEENSFNFRGIKRVTQEFHQRQSKSCLREGDVLMVQTGDVGLTTVVPMELAGANCHALIISRFKAQRFNSLYFSYFLNSADGRNKLKDLEVGTTMKHINVGDLLNFIVPVPSSLEEQTAIANALSDVDALIAALEKLINKKSVIKTAAMQQLLTGKKRLPPFDQLNTGYKQTELGEIPGDWEVVELGTTTCFLASGKTSTKAIVGEYPLYGSTGLIGVCQKAEYDGDAILVARVGANAGKLNFVSGEYGVSDNTIIIKVDNNYDTHFVKLSLIRKNLNSLVFGSGQPLITGTQLKSILIAIPPKKEQAAIANVLSDMDKDLEILQQRLHKTQQIKQGMMQELLTGRTRLI